MGRCVLTYNLGNVEITLNSRKFLQYMDQSDFITIKNHNTVVYCGGLDDCLAQIKRLCGKQGGFVNIIENKVNGEDGNVECDVVIKSNKQRADNNMYKLYFKV